MYNPEMPNSTRLSDLDEKDKLKRRKNWDIETGELLKGGAEYDELGHLAITVPQYESLNKERIEDERKKFLENTEEGRQIEEQKALLYGFIDALGKGYLEWQGEFSREDLDPANASNLKTIEEEYTAIMRENGFNDKTASAIDFSLLRSPDSFENMKYAKTVIQILRECLETLDNLSARLAQRPDLRIGQAVAVMRSFKEGETEPRKETGWVIEGITARGRVRIRHQASNGDNLTKDVNIEDLEAWNLPTKSIRQ